MVEVDKREQRIWEQGTDKRQKAKGKRQELIKDRGIMISFTGCEGNQC